MSSLNVLCGICSEYFKNSDIIYSTTRCGHVFHQQCLLRWLGRASSCPQCRANCHRRLVHRLYLNFSEPLPLDEDDMSTVKTFEWFPLDANVLTAEEIEKLAFKLDCDETGGPIYAARVYFNDDLLPGYYVPSKKGVYASWGCSSHFLQDDIELLQVDKDSEAEYKWVADEKGEIPESSLAFGYSESGETLYLARASHEGKTRYGKLHPSHGVCYVPYEEKEIGVDKYEVLVRKAKSAA